MLLLFSSKNVSDSQTSFDYNSGVYNRHTKSLASKVHYLIYSYPILEFLNLIKFSFLL